MHGCHSSQRCLCTPPGTCNAPVCLPSQVAPYLRGEWDTSKVGLLAPPEQRIQLAVDALLGAVPIWFKVRRFGAAAASLVLCSCPGVFG